MNEKTPEIPASESPLGWRNALLKIVMDAETAAMTRARCEGCNARMPFALRNSELRCKGCGKPLGQPK